MARPSKNHGYKVLALVIAFLLWGMAQGQTSIERGFDIPVQFEGVPERVVLTEQSSDVVNIRVMGSRAALRNIVPSDMEYKIDVSGARSGGADYEVDLSGIELPRGSKLVARSPSSIHVIFEPRATRSVRVRADLEGEPAAGLKVAAVEVDPTRARITGARSEVLRLTEVVTETVDISGATESVERPVRVALGGGHLWVEDPEPVTVRVRIEAASAPDATAPPRKTPGRKGGG